MINKIGQSSYGLYTLATSLIATLMLDWGMGASVSRYVAKYNAEKNQKKIENVLGIIYKLYIFIDIFMMIVLVIVFFFLSDIFIKLEPTELEKFKVIYIMISIFSLISFPCIPFNGILTAYEKFIQLKFCDLLSKVSTVLIMVIVLCLNGGLYSLVITNIICSLGTMLLKLYFIKRTTSAKINIFYFEKKLLKEIFAFSMWDTVCSVGDRLTINIVPSILGIVSSVKSIAIFGVANVLNNYIFIFASAINGIFLPKISKILFTRDGNTDVLPLMIKVGRVQLMVVGIITICFASLGRHFINLWMGDTYLNSHYSCLIMTIPFLILCTQEVANTSVILLNKVKERGIIFICCAIVNIIFAFILSPKYGSIGVAISVAFSYIIRTICLNILYYKKLNINIFNFFKECHLKMIVQLSICTIIAFLINHYLPSLGWFWLIVKGVLIFAIYAIIMWFFVMNQYEKNIFIIPANKIFDKIRI